ncbi:hypothetical protein CCHR01_08197 [Colletotrichum chrysophilum]|uniref:Uncharacterized protein n=1 Tax=Colletotrichum chrysophilum TaxID=1836956 RepID=A0AAD9AP03_9PEZI|nr:hypothetical protein CCHR01_08197 [Colletotrichum chrysophilum]
MDEKPKPPSKDTTTTESPQLAYGNGNDAHIHGRASFLSLLPLLLLLVSPREREKEKDGREFYHPTSPPLRVGFASEKGIFGMLQGSDGRSGFGHLRRQTTSCLAVHRYYLLVLSPLPLPVSSVPALPRRVKGSWSLSR